MPRNQVRGLAVVLALTAIAAACGARQTPLERLHAQPAREYMGRYTIGPGGSWFRPCSAAASDSAWWVTAVGTATEQIGDARRTGRLPEGQPTFVHWRGVITEGGEVGPRGPGAPALLVREVIVVGGAAPPGCAAA